MKTYQVRWIPLKCEKMGTRRKHEILFPKIPIPFLEKNISCTGRICKFTVGRNGCLIWTRPRPLSSVSGKIPPIPDLSCFVSSAHCASEVVDPPVLGIFCDILQKFILFGLFQSGFGRRSVISTLGLSRRSGFGWTDCELGPETWAMNVSWWLWLGNTYSNGPIPILSIQRLVGSPTFTSWKYISCIYI